MAAPIINYVFCDFFRLFGIEECERVIKEAGRSEATAKRYAALMKAYWVDNIKTAGRPGAVFTGDFQRALADEYPDYQFGSSLSPDWRSRQPFTQIDSAIAYIDSTGVIDYCAILFESANYKVFIFDGRVNLGNTPTKPVEDFGIDLVPGPDDGVEP